MGGKVRFPTMIAARSDGHPGVTTWPKVAASFVVPIDLRRLPPTLSPGGHTRCYQPSAWVIFCSAATRMEVSDGPVRILHAGRALLARLGCGRRYRRRPGVPGRGLHGSRVGHDPHELPAHPRHDDGATSVAEGRPRRVRRGDGIDLRGRGAVGSREG